MATMLDSIFYWFLSDFQWILKSKQNPLKSHQKSIKNEVQDVSALNIEFYSILVDFESQVGAKLKLETDQKSIQKGILKKKKNEGNLKASWKRFGSVSLL